MSEINVLSLSYGKDSLATIAACEQWGIPIHRIIHAEVWATDEIPADLPPMVEFKKKADAIIKERWGLEVEHICAMTTPDKKYGLFSRCPSDGRGKQTYESLFYTKLGRGKFVGTIKGFPMVKKGWCRHLKPQGETDVRRYLLSSYQEPSQERERERRYGFPFMRAPWCTGELKSGALEDAKKLFSNTPQQQGAETNTVVSLLGIAADEPERIERHMKKPNVRLPLVEIGWTEADCRKWCEENELLSPIYTTATRGGAVGSVTIRESVNCDCSARTTPTFGHCS